MAGRKRIITKGQADRFMAKAETDPQGALKDLKATIAVRVATDKLPSYKIDALQRTPKRRVPQRVTQSLDQEFSRSGDRDSMIATARDLIRNFGFAAGILRSHVKNIIGRGPMLQATTDDPEFNKRAEKHWNRRKDLLHSRGMMDFATSLRVGERREVIDGDYGAVMLPGNRLQYIEADRIKDPPKGHDKGAVKLKRGHSVIDGVELNGDGRPVQYHIWERGKSFGGKGKYIGGIIAQDFIHCFEFERFDQSRGVTWFLAAVNDMQDLREVMEAAKGAWKIGSMLGVAITSDMPEQDALASLWGTLTDFPTTNQDGDEDTNYEVVLEQGVHSFELRPGEKIEQIKSEAPNSTFEPMTLLQIRLIALTLDMPLEIALQFFSRGGYSAHRSAMLQYFEWCRMRRETIEACKLNRIYHWTIEGEIARGNLDGPKDKTVDVRPHEWQWPGLGLLDPDKERKADVEAYRLGVVSNSDITGRDGRNWQDVALRRINEIKWITEHAIAAGVEPSMVLPQVANPGQPLAGATDDSSGSSVDDDPEMEDE